MKRMLLLAILVAVFGAKSANGDPLDPLLGAIFPQKDFKYVEFIPSRHLHKNKSRYQEYDWQILVSDHFWVFYYGEGVKLAQYYLSESEKIYSEYNERFSSHPMREKIRVFVFNSSRDFEENNLVEG